MTEDEPEPSKEHKEIWTYIGRRILSAGGSIRYGWMKPQTNEDSETKPEVFYYKKRLCSVQIGGQVEFTVLEDDRFYSSGSKGPRALLESHEDQNDIAKWFAQDEMAMKERHLKSVERKALNIDPLEDILGRIKDVAPKLTWAERRALASRVMEELFAY